jgi:hypothetical protein
LLAGTVAAVVSGSGLVLAHEMSDREGGPRWHPSAEDMRAFTKAGIAALKAGLAVGLMIALLAIVAAPQVSEAGSTTEINAAANAKGS